MIICCGEALIDMIPMSDNQGQTSFMPKSGGAVFNTAIALGRLGLKTSFISGLSNDLFGKQLVNDLENSQVDTSLTVNSDRPTTLAFVELNDGQASYTFYDENTAGRMLDPNMLPVIPDEAEALFFGGISLISEPGADFYAALVVRESENKIIIIDPNIRTGFITDEPHYRNRLNRMIAHADILKVSDEDLDWIIPDALPVEEKISRVTAIGPMIVLLTKGSHGAAAYINGRLAVEVPAQAVEVVDTVGAGDTFNAGVIARLASEGVLIKTKLKEISQEQLEHALTYGAQVAAITVSRSGANPPWAVELS
ncbi:MAG: carbohydrate kinase family protein [Thiolinea sp.]